MESVIDEINPDYIGNIEVPIPVSKSKYLQIVKMLKESEQYRHLGILNYTEAIEKMEALLAS